MLKMKLSSSIAAMTMLIGTVVPTASTANEIALTLKELDITISGTFVGFRENAYVVETASGPLHVPANIVTGEGSDCLLILSANDTGQ